MALGIYIETYGCQMNLADTEVVLGHLGRQGWVPTDDPGRADAILLNTCAIREHAEERVIGRLTDLARVKAERPDVLLGMCGCLAQHQRTAIADRVRALDFVVGPDAYRRLPALLDAVRAARAGVEVDVRLDPGETYEDLPPARTPGAVRAWVTAMRGCDRFCTFCVVPFVRGRERSLPAEAVVADVRAAVANGAREVVLLGQTVNAYHDGTCDFAALLARIAEVDDLLRIRFTSPHPADMTPALIRTIAELPKVAPQLHLPVQSGSDTVLARMARDYTVAEYRDLVDALRTAVPDLALSTDIIVGFPDESPADFDATCRLLEDIRFDHAFLFKFSRRSLTRAAKWADSVPEQEKSRRLSHVIALQETISAERNRRWIGRRIEVLVEGPARRPPGHVAGKTPHFTTAIVAGEAAPGTLLTATVTGSTAHTLIAVADAVP